MRGPFLYASSVIARAAITLLAVSLLVFFAMQAIPGSFESLYLGTNATDEVIQALREKFGFNRPLPEQYVRWLGGLLSGNLGDSLISGRPITDQLAFRLPATIQLAVMSSLLSVPAGVALGIATGTAKVRGRASGVGRFLSALSSSIPDFVLATILVFVASLIGWRIIGAGYVPFTQDPVASTIRMLLPALTLSFVAGGLVARATRDAVLAVRAEPFVTMAIARGERVGEITRRHIVRNIANPIVTIAAINVGYLLGGALIIERIFAIPGIGEYAVGAVFTRDYPVVMATVMLGATAFVVANTLADLVSGLIDPRIGARQRTGS